MIERYVELAVFLSWRMLSFLPSVSREEGFSLLPHSFPARSNMANLTHHLLIVRLFQMQEASSPHRTLKSGLCFNTMFHNPNPARPLWHLY